MNIENETLTDKHYNKLIQIYKSIENSQISEDELGIVSRIFLKFDYFIKLEKIIGYKGIELIAKHMKLRQYRREQIIYKIGEQNNTFYLIIKGEVEIYNYEIYQKEKNIKLATLKQGNIFGDYFSSSKKKTNWRVVCSSDTIILQISHQDIMNILNETDLNTIDKCYEILKNFEIFKDLIRSSLERFYLAMEKKKYRRGQVVFKEGDDIENDGLYFIYSGEFMISKLHKKHKDKLKSLNKEINSLEKEANILLTCLRGYNPKSALIKSLYDYETQKNPGNVLDKKLTKNKIATVKVIIIKENEYFGDIEFFNNTTEINFSNKRMITVTCSSDNATVYYAPFQKFEKHLNPCLKEKFTKTVADKKRIFNKRYEDVAKGKEILCNMFGEPKKLKMFSYGDKNEDALGKSKGKNFPQINLTSRDNHKNMIDDLFNYKDCLNIIRQKRFNVLKMDRVFMGNKDELKIKKYFYSTDKKSAKEKNLKYIEGDSYYSNTVIDYDVKKTISIFNSSSKDFSGVLRIPKIKSTGDAKRAINVSRESINYLNLRKTINNFVSKG